MLLDLDFRTVDDWTLLQEFRRHRQRLAIIIITASKDDRLS